MRLLHLHTLAASFIPIIAVREYSQKSIKTVSKPSCQNQSSLNTRSVCPALTIDSSTELYG